MQHMNGNDNIQIMGDGNIITVAKPIDIDRTSHAAEMAQNSSVNIYRLMKENMVEVPTAALFLISMFAVSFLAKNYFYYLFGLAGALLVIWYLLPIKFSSLMGSVEWDRFDRGYDNVISFRDIHRMQMVGKNIYIVTFDRKTHKISFLNPKGADDLFDAFSIYVKL